MSNLRRAAWLLGFFVVSFLCLRYLAGFSAKQSVAILIVIGILLEYLDDTLSHTYVAARRRGANFSPHRVLLCPNWHRIFLDYKLVKDDEEFWEAWEKGLKETPLISFTTLQPERETDLPGMVYWDSQKCFVSEAAFEQPLTGIAFRSCLDDKHESPVIRDETSGKDDMGFTLRPEVYFTWVGRAGRGYEMGLTVRESWWRWIRSTSELGEFAETHVDTNHLTGETRLALAILPYSEFQIYYEGYEYDDKRRRKQEELKERDLAACGWKRQQRDLDAEVRDPWERVEHKYFTIQHRAI